MYVYRSDGRAIDGRTAGGRRADGGRTADGRRTADAQRTDFSYSEICLSPGPTPASSFLVLRLNIFLKIAGALCL